jgi:GMP synthase (glutamine-hydrolysing)
MKPNVLLIQFRRSENAILHEQMCMTRMLEKNTTCTSVSALDQSISWDEPEKLLLGISAVILGGSGDFDFDGGRNEDDPDRQMSYTLLERLRPLFEYIFEYDIPTLGICYGHQLLGAFAGANVHNDHIQKKSRSHEVRLLADAQGHFLFSELPESFSAIYGHKDSLDRVPKEAILLVEGGEQCKVSALQYKNNIFSTQFHPELTFSDIVERLKNSPGYLPEGVILADLFTDDVNANRILANFGSFVALKKLNSV